MTFGKPGFALMASLAFCPKASAADVAYFACLGTLTTASNLQDSALQEEPWMFSLAVDSDKNAVTIDDTSMPIMSDASEPIVGFKDDPTVDPSLDGFWGGFNTVTGGINIHVRAGAIFTGTCKRARRDEIKGP